MNKTHHARFLLSATILLVLLVIVIVLLTVGGLGRNRQPGSPGFTLQSADILIHDEERIWWLNPSSLSLELLVDVTQEGLMIGGDVRALPQHDHIYMTAWDIGEDPDRLRLDNTSHTNKGCISRYSI